MRSRLRAPREDTLYAGFQALDHAGTLSLEAVLAGIMPDTRGDRRAARRRGRAGGVSQRWRSVEVLLGTTMDSSLTLLRRTGRSGCGKRREEMR
jgi:hypothetical protein